MPMPAENPPSLAAPSTFTATPPSSELDLFAYAVLLLKHARFILLCGLVAFLIMVVAMLTAKPRYEATAVMIVPQNNPNAALLAAKLGGGTLDLIGGGYELYADILRSRSVADELIAEFDLTKVYKVKSAARAELVLSGRTKVETKSEGMLRVTVQDEDARRAADLANAYLHHLDLLNSKLALTTASRERAFLEREMVAEKDRLADAEVALVQHQERGAGLPPEAEASADLSALETTRVQLRAAQVRLAALLTAETDANPDVVRVRGEIAGLTAELNELEHGAQSVETGTPVKQMPQQTLEYTRRLRDVKFHEALFELLEKQFEVAKQEEAKSPSIVEVLDPAIPSEFKAWPPRTVYCLIAALAGVFAGVMLVTVYAFVRAFVEAPQNAERIAGLKRQYLAWLPRGV